MRRPPEHLQANSECDARPADENSVICKTDELATKSVRSLTSRTMSALKWNYVGTLFRSFSGIIISIVLARILGPRPFGLLAGAWLVISWANLLADFGLGSALVQRAQISIDDVRYVFTFQTLIGILLTIGGLSLAPVASLLFGQPELTLLIQVLSLSFILQAMGLTAASLLKRELRFKTFQNCQITSYLLGYCLIGIGLAEYGAGVWSLVTAQLAQTGIFSLLAYRSVRHKLKPLFRAPSSGLFRFGSKVFLANCVNWAISNADTGFVARGFGPTSLGLYNRTTTILTAPITAIVTTLQQVLFPAYSQASANDGRAEKAFVASISVVSLITFPIYFSAAVIPDVIIRGVFGVAWASASPVLPPMALSLPFFALMAMCGPFLWARNKIKREIIAHVAAGAMLVICLLFTFKTSLAAVAWVVLAGCVVRFLLVTRVALSELNLSSISYLRIIGGPIGVAIFCAIAVFACSKLLAMTDLKPHLKLAICLATGVLSSGSTVLVFSSSVFSPELLNILRAHELSIPTWLRLVLFKRRALPQVGA